MPNFPPQELIRASELTLFAPDASRADIEKLCAEARKENALAVCVNGSRVELARSLLDESNVQVVALVGFPLGAADTDAKRYETEIAVDHGAHEIDFVLNHGFLKDGNLKLVLREMRDIAEAADERPVKVVLEPHLLTREEIVTACQLVVEAGARFVSASTGFHAPAVTAENVQLLREAVGGQFGVKAFWDGQDEATAQALLDAGATRIGLLFGS